MASVICMDRAWQMNFKTESLVSWGTTEECHMAFCVCGAVHFSVIKRMLTFLLILQVLTSLFVGSVEPGSCLSDAFVIVRPGSVTWWLKLEVFREGRFIAKKKGVRHVACWFVNGGAICKHYIREQSRLFALVFFSIVLTNLISSVKFVLSITSVDCGWKEAVSVLSYWSSLVRLVQNLGVKIHPCLEWSLPGQRKRVIQWSTKTLVIIWAGLSGSATG